MFTAPDRFRRWYDFEQDAHAKVARSLESVPAERQDGPEYKRAVGLIGHLAAARRMWLFRLGGAPAAPASIFPENLTLAAALADLQDVQGLWSRYLDRLTDAELARTFDYQSLDGGRFRSIVEDILTQLFHHSAYHRGQIAMLVKQAGGQPALTDFVFWSRQRLAE